MGFFSKIKKRIKQAWRAVKATVRAIVKVVLEIVMRVINLVLVWLPVQKKMRLQVFVLRDESGNPLLNDKTILKELQDALDFAIKTFKDRFDVKIKRYGNPIIQILPDNAPPLALDVECGGGAVSNEFGTAGEYFANNLAGWNLIPIHLGFPITVFIVRSIDGKIGCSMNSITDYITVSVAGAKSENTMAHELGHCCSLAHRDNINNLMFPDDSRGNKVTGWQKFVVRNSRHCTFW
jgi:hypothetical protein